MTRYRCQHLYSNGRVSHESIFTHREAIQHLVDSYVDYYEDSTDDEAKRLITDRADANRIYKTQNVKKLKEFLVKKFDKVEVIP